MILTVDLGTSVTKLALWEPDRLVAIARRKLDTFLGPEGRVEQVPETWWESVRAACAELLADGGSEGVRGRSPVGAIEVICFSAARQSFVPVDSACRPLGRALLWSDRRATGEAASLNARFGGAEELRRRTGIYHDAGSMAAKIAWLVAHEPQRIASARWLVSPRDLLVHELTGEVVTDQTLASATGLYGANGEPDEELVDAALSALAPASNPPGRSRLQLARLLPEVRRSDRVVGRLREGPARVLGLESGIPVVVGAGDRACEVLGAGASQRMPMVSWGTTANVSVPLRDRPDHAASGMILTRGALGGWLLEGGMSAAGSLVEWIARSTNTESSHLFERARDVAPGANGVTVLPWLGGARAPWWRADVGAAVLGLRPEHGPDELARAAVEGVAFDVARCLEAAYPGDRGPSGLALAGAGSTGGAWADVLSAICALGAASRRSGEAASAGAALVAARGVGIDLDLDTLDPVQLEVAPDPHRVEQYRRLRPMADELAAAILEVHGSRSD